MVVLVQEEKSEEIQKEREIFCNFKRDSRNI